MRNGLVPEKRTDINGVTRTRWVKQGADGKPAPRGIPAPKSANAKEMASKVRLLLFPETQVENERPDEEYAVTINGMSTFYSPAFAQQTLERVPVRTLRLLGETIAALPHGTAKKLVAQTVYDLMREMHDMGGTAAAPIILKEQSRIVSNTCIFSGMSEVVSKATDENNVSTHMFMIDQSVHAYENDGYLRSNLSPSERDYAAASPATREEAQNYVMADQLHRHYGSPVERLPADSIALVADYRGQWDRLAAIAKERGFSDTDAIRMVMESDVQALSEGSL